MHEHAPDALFCIHTVSAARNNSFFGRADLAADSAADSEGSEDSEDSEEDSEAGHKRRRTRRTRRRTRRRLARRRTTFYADAQPTRTIKL